MLPADICLANGLSRGFDFYDTTHVIALFRCPEYSLVVRASTFLTAIFISRLIDTSAPAVHAGLSIDSLPLQEPVKTFRLAIMTAGLPYENIPSGKVEEYVFATGGYC